MTHSGIFVDVIGAGLELIPQGKLRAILEEFPRLSMKKQFRDCLCGVVRRKPLKSRAKTAAVRKNGSLPPKPCSPRRGPAAEDGYGPIQTNSSAYIAKSFMLLAQNIRASSDSRISSLPCSQNCRAASRASSQTSNVFAVACGSISSRGGTWPSAVGAYSIET